MEWLWDHSHASGNHYDPTAFPFFSPDWHGIPLQSIFSVYSPTSLPFLQWVVAKCAVLGQRLVFNDHFVYPWISNGSLELLNYTLHSGDVLVVVWPRDIVRTAIQFGQLKVLEWWDRHQDQLPPQDLNCSSRLFSPTRRDAAGVLNWCHAHPHVTASKVDWQGACLQTIYSDAGRVQRWLLEHMDLIVPDEHDDANFHARVWELEMIGVTPFTLEFMSAISPVPDPCTSSPPLTPPSEVYTLFSSLLCYYNRYKEDELLMLEWWLQAHLAAGHRIVLPGAEELDRVFSDADGDSRHWLYDVTVTRGLPVYVESEAGIEPFLSRSMSGSLNPGARWFTIDLMLASTPNLAHVPPPTRRGVRAAALAASKSSSTVLETPASSWSTTASRRHEPPISSQARLAQLAHFISDAKWSEFADHLAAHPRDATLSDPRTGRPLLYHAIDLHRNDFARFLLRACALPTTLVVPSSVSAMASPATPVRTAVPASLPESMEHQQQP
ncbi:hypothetical protein BC828DRAFT_409983, partial [Blastocladiella britannica]